MSGPAPRDAAALSDLRPGAPAPVSPGSGEAPPASLTTRIVGAVALLLGGLAAFVLVRRVFELDFGAENPRVLWIIRAAALVVPGYPALLGLVALATGRRPQEPLNPLGLPFEGWWFATLAAMTWRELKRVFYHPVFYVVLFVFLLMNGFLFAALLDHYAGPGTFGQDFHRPASYFVTDNGFLWLSLILICPALTMRLLAEEQRSGTLEMLLTAPVSDIQVVLSKFLAALGCFACMTAVTLVYLVVIRQYAPEWDWGPVFGGYAGLLLAGALFLAIGLFTSSITESQIIAYLLAALPLFGLVFLVGMLESQLTNQAWLQAGVRHVSVMEHQHALAGGVLHFKTLVFYASGTAFFLFLAVRGVESHKWR